MKKKQYREFIFFVILRENSTFLFNFVCHIYIPVMVMCGFVKKMNLTEKYNNE